MQLSIIVPCYNEAENIVQLYESVASACTLVRELSEWELVLVDDGSHDATWNYIQSIAAQDSRVRGIRLSRNFGHQMALSAGLDSARGERLFIIDADLQDPPEHLAAMMAKMDEGFDVVYGQRRTRSGETAFKRGSAKLYYRILNRLSDVAIPPDTGDFRLMTRRVADTLKDMPESVRYVRGMVSWAGFAQTPYLYDRAPRYQGKTHYTLSRMLRLALDGITSFSVRPLRAAFYLGLLMMALSGILLMYVLWSWLLSETVRGWTSLLAIFLIFQGAQWLFMGLMGEYLGRIYLETKHRPKYVVREVT